jgi:hypothetical protein
MPSAWIPASARRILTLRRLALLFLGFLIAVLSVSIALRIQAATFAYRVSSVVSELAKIEPGKTSRSQVSESIKGLYPVVDSDRTNSGSCKTDECLVLEIPTSAVSYWILEQALKFDSEGELVIPALDWLGVRIWQFHAGIRLNSGVVTNYNYSLIASNGSYKLPGALYARVSLVDRFRSHELSPIDDESPHYRVTHFRKWPEWETSILLTPEVSPKFKAHAFDLRLNCLWSVRGCRTVDQLLPSVDQDKRQIEIATLARLNSSKQCPEAILKRRVRDGSDINLVEVIAVRAGAASVWGKDYKIANIRLIQSLSGGTEGPFKEIQIATTLENFGPPIPNSVIEFLKPGEKLLLFSDNSQNIDMPCEAMRATNSALSIIETELQKNSSLK